MATLQRKEIRRGRNLRRPPNGWIRAKSGTVEPLRPALPPKRPFANCRAKLRRGSGTELALLRGLEIDCPVIYH